MSPVAQPPLAEAVEVDALLETVWVSLVAGLGVTGSFGLLILGATGAAEARAAGRSGAAALYAALAVVALLVCAGLIVLGIAAMTSKD